MSQRLLPETPAPKKMSLGKKWAIWGLIAAGVFIIGLILTMNFIIGGITSSMDKDLPGAQGNNSGEQVSGQQVTAASTTPAIKPGEYNTAALKFYDQDSKSSLTHEQLVESTKITVDEYPDALSAQTRFYEIVSAAASVDPTQEEVQNNVGSSTEIDDYYKAATIKRDAMLSNLYGGDSGRLRAFIDELCGDAYDVQIANYGTSATGEPATKYKVNVEYAKTHDALIVTDNVAETELVDPAAGITPENVTGFLTGRYELTFTGYALEKVTEDGEEVWKFGNRLVIAKSA